MGWDFLFRARGKAPGFGIFSFVSEFLSPGFGIFLVSGFFSPGFGIFLVSGFLYPGFGMFLILGFYLRDSGFFSFGISRGFFKILKSGIGIFSWFGISRQKATSGLSIFIHKFQYFPILRSKIIFLILTKNF